MCHVIHEPDEVNFILRCAMSDRSNVYSRSYTIRHMTLCQKLPLLTYLCVQIANTVTRLPKCIDFD